MLDPSEVRIFKGELLHVKAGMPAKSITVSNAEMTKESRFFKPSP